MSKQKPTRRERSEQQNQTPPAKPAATAPARLPEELRHFRFGWWSLFVFVSLGVLLEAFLAFRIGWYMDTGANETHRLMLRLGHAHGTLLALVHIVFGLSLPALAALTARSRTVASRCLFAASILLPGGFFLGGLFLYGGDPGLGILLVPAAVVPLWLGVFLTARGAGKG